MLMIGTGFDMMSKSEKVLYILQWDVGNEFKMVTRRKQYNWYAYQYRSLSLSYDQELNLYRHSKSRLTKKCEKLLLKDAIRMLKRVTWRLKIKLVVGLCPSIFEFWLQCFIIHCKWNVNSRKLLMSYNTVFYSWSSSNKIDVVVKYLSGFSFENRTKCCP